MEAHEEFMKHFESFTLCETQIQDYNFLERKIVEKYKKGENAELFSNEIKLLRENLSIIRRETKAFYNFLYQFEDRFSHLFSFDFKQQEYVDLLGGFRRLSSVVDNKYVIAVFKDEPKTKEYIDVKELNTNLEFFSKLLKKELM